MKFLAAASCLLVLSKASLNGEIKIPEASGFNSNVACGNFKYEPENFEECDNGNRKGCRYCVVEPGYFCKQNPAGISFCIRNTVMGRKCGNGRLEIDKQEGCDDRNLQNGDGCSSTCEVEENWDCSLMDSRRMSHCVKKFPQQGENCGNGYLQKDLSQWCDDGNLENMDGCSSSCRVESGYSCMERYLYPASICKNTCGNGVLEVTLGETCDDGNLFSGDGCSYDCQVEEEWECDITTSGMSHCHIIPVTEGILVQAPAQRTLQTHGGGNSRGNDQANAWKVYAQFCGNGVLEYYEQCDDGNKLRQDGCSDKCEVEMGWGCNILEVPTYCFPS